MKGIVPIYLLNFEHKFLLNLTDMFLKLMFLDAQNLQSKINTNCGVPTICKTILENVRV